MELSGENRGAEPTVRAARAEEVGAVLTLWAEHGSGLSSIPDDRAELERLVASSPGSLIVAELGDGIVGALIAAFDGHRGHMHRLAVARAHRGGGVGRRLVDAAHEHLRRLGARRVDAIVGVEEQAAAALWSSAGYESDPPHLARWARNL